MQQACYQSCRLLSSSPRLLSFALSVTYLFPSLHHCRLLIFFDYLPVLFAGNTGRSRDTATTTALWAEACLPSGRLLKPAQSLVAGLRPCCSACTCMACRPLGRARSDVESRGRPQSQCRIASAHCWRHTPLETALLAGFAVRTSCKLSQLSLRLWEATRGLS